MTTTLTAQRYFELIDADTERLVEMGERTSAEVGRVVAGAAAHGKPFSAVDVGVGAEVGADVLTREGLPFQPFEAWSDVARAIIRRGA